MRAIEKLLGQGYVASLEREFEEVAPPAEMVGDFMTEHSLTGGVLGGDYVIQATAWPAETLQDEVDHFYPGATVDEFGMVSGGWPDEASLVANRRPGERKGWRRWFR